MKNLSFLFIVISLVSLSCGGSVNKIFGKKSPHEAYSDKVDKTVAGKQWVATSISALAQPYEIALPYTQQGYFPTDKPRALALRFSAVQGEQINVRLNRKSLNSPIIFADLFKQDGAGMLHILAADTSNTEFSIDISETGSYLLRLQPELHRVSEYNLSLTKNASLGFPVAGSKAKAGSFWGADRDGGSRRHEGIDIFAPKRTPVIAAADGFVTSIREGGLGGKTVWMKVIGKNINLYYAHLDKQLVHTGQLVKKGDTLGLVGNTGNAKHTPPHLHFGIYGNNGAIDPWPYVNRISKSAPAPASKSLSAKLELKKPLKGISGTVQAKTVLMPVAVTSSGYLAELPDGTFIHAPFPSVRPISANETIAKEQTTSGEAG
jgi:murein DD-endopeptidase MepM/ murein hydrolase activator NlpD